MTRRDDDDTPHYGTKPTPPPEPEQQPVPEPLPYPGWRWNEDGDSKVVANKEEDVQAAKEGYTLKSAPQPKDAPKAT